MAVQNFILWSFFVQITENFAFYETFCMQLTLLRAKTICFKSEMGCRIKKSNSFKENSLKHVNYQFERPILACVVLG